MHIVEKTFLINGYNVKASYDSECIETVFLPLLAHLRNLKEEKKGRILVFLAAPPGVGKTTLSMFLEFLANKENNNELQAIGMDGFHRRQDYLQSHTMMRDGKEETMVTLKGSFETFDHNKLERKIKQLIKNKVVKWPLYDRTLHNPIEDQIEVTADIVLLEGNYLLLNEESWSDLKQYCDVSIFISTTCEYVKERLIERKMLGGVSREDAQCFYEKSDAYNVKYVLMHSQTADITLHMSDNGRIS